MSQLQVVCTIIWKQIVWHLCKLSYVADMVADDGIGVDMQQLKPAREIHAKDISGNQPSTLWVFWSSNLGRPTFRS